MVDASVVANAVGDDAVAGDAARQRLAADRQLHAPHLVDLEVLTVLRRLSSMGDLAPTRAREAVSDLAELGIRRHSHRPLLHRIWELRDTVKSYDASYVALAEWLGCSLVTADRGLSRLSGVHCSIELLRAS
ncbi:MAG: type II toxin-antitoxin system VapC family toxin [Actinomycetota bacterium]